MSTTKCRNMKKNITDQLYTIKEAAKYKKMEYEAFRYYCVVGRGPIREKLGNIWIFNKDHLDSWHVNDVRIKSRKNP